MGKKCFFSCLDKHLNIVWGVLPACRHVAEVDHVSQGRHDRVKEEAQSKKDEEMLSPWLQNR